MNLNKVSEKIEEMDMRNNSYEVLEIMLHKIFLKHKMYGSKNRKARAMCYGYFAHRYNMEIIFRVTIMKV